MTITLEMLEAQKKSLQKELERIEEELDLTEQMISNRKGQDVSIRSKNSSKMPKHRSSTHLIGS